MNYLGRKRCPGGHCYLVVFRAHGQALRLRLTQVSLVIIIMITCFISSMDDGNASFRTDQIFSSPTGSWLLLFLLLRAPGTVSDSKQPSGEMVRRIVRT